MPCLSEHVCLLSDSRLARAFIDLTGIHQDGLFTPPLGRASRLRIALNRRPRKPPKHQMVGKLLDFMEDAALVCHAVEMILQGALKPLGAVADYQGRRRLCDAFQIQLPKERLPGVGRFARCTLPMHDFPRPIGPYPECAQYHPLLLALARAASAPRIFADLASGIGNLDPHAIDEDNRRRGRKGPLRERLHVLGHTRHNAVTGGKREYRAQGQGHRLLQIPHTVP